LALHPLLFVEFPVGLPPEGDGPKPAHAQPLGFPTLPVFRHVAQQFRRAGVATCTIDAEIAAEQANERALEDRGWEDTLRDEEGR
jgi:hypothetical protein